jgi:hypothetical protein
MKRLQNITNTRWFAALVACAAVFAAVLWALAMSDAQRPPEHGIPAVDPAAAAQDQYSNMGQGAVAGAGGGAAFGELGCTTACRMHARRPCARMCIVCQTAPDTGACLAGQCTHALPHARGSAHCSADAPAARTHSPHAQAARSALLAGLRARRWARLSAPWPAQQLAAWRRSSAGPQVCAVCSCPSAVPCCVTAPCAQHTTLYNTSCTAPLATVRRRRGGHDPGGRQHSGCVDGHPCQQAAATRALCRGAECCWRRVLCVCWCARCRCRL